MYIQVYNIQSDKRMNKVNIMIVSINNELALIDMKNTQCSENEITLLKHLDRLDFNRVYPLDDTITIGETKCGWVADDKTYGFSRKLIQNSIKIIVALGYKKSDIVFMTPLSVGFGYMEIKHIKIVMANLNLE